MKISFFTFVVALLCLSIVATVSAGILDIITIGIIPDNLQVLNIPSILLVLSGVFMVTAISYPPEVIKKSIPFLFKFFSHSIISNKTKDIDIDLMLQWQQQLRINNRKTRAELSNKLEQTFEGYIFGLLSTGYSKEQVKEMALSKARKRYQQMIGIADLYGSMAKYAPAFGMLGTLVGLIHMLGSFDSIEDLGIGLSFALMTTFYGLLFANLLFNPLEEKLNTVAQEEYSRNKMMLDGILLINDGSQPLYVYDVLNANKNTLEIGNLPPSLTNIL
jgi:chemotaxis protein MotA